MRTEVTMSASAGVLDVAKKKDGAGFRTTPVKIETGLVRKARTIADDKGVDLSEYLSGLIRGAIDRDWTKILKKIAESEIEGED
jgi:hypothetical protein